MSEYAEMLLDADNSRLLVEDEEGNEYEIDSKLGAGGQGAVYTLKNLPNLVVKMKLNECGNPLTSEEEYYKQLAVMERLISLPDIPQTAVPLKVLKKPYIGYIMRLMEDMRPMEKEMIIEGNNNSISMHYLKTGGLSHRIDILLHLAEILSDMHNHGMVYCDISPKNIFVSENVNHSQVWLIDTDNMHFGSDKQNATCIGTPLYRAPEVYRGEPNSYASDVYSFALLAYEYLTGNRAFNGEACDADPDEDDWDDEPGTEIDEDSGELPWIHDKQDNSNKTSAGYGIPWELICTEKIQDLFHQTFTEGRKDPALRPSMLEWKIALQEERLLIVQCQNKHAHLNNKCMWCNKETVAYEVIASKIMPLVSEEENSSFSIPVGHMKCAEVRGQPIEIPASILGNDYSSHSLPIVSFYRQLQGYRISLASNEVQKMSLKIYQDDKLITPFATLKSINKVEIRLLQNSKPVYIIQIKGGERA